MHEINEKLLHAARTLEQAANQSGLMGRTLRVYCADGALVFLPKECTALDVLHALTVLKDMITDLMCMLTNACGTCDGACGSKLCLHTELHPQPQIVVPAWMREEADIPMDAKLDGFCTPETGEIRLHQADYRYDLTDVDSDILKLLRDSGVCLSRLDELLKAEELLDDE